MKSSFLLSSLVATAVFSVATLGTSLAQQTRSVGSFNMIKTSGAIDVVLTQGATTSVKVDADSDVLDHIKTEVRDGALVLYRDKSSILNGLLNSNQVTIHITCPTLTGVEASGASEIKSTTPFSADNFTIKASGASDVTMAINAKNLTAAASGASEVRLTGRVERQQVHISGSSDYQAYNLQSRTADVQASGASDAYVAVSETLSSQASGASDIHYKGKPRVTK